MNQRWQVALGIAVGLAAVIGLGTAGYDNQIKSPSKPEVTTANVTSKPITTTPQETKPVVDPIIKAGKRCLDRQWQHDALYVCASLDIKKLKRTDAALHGQVAKALLRIRTDEEKRKNDGRWNYYTVNDQATGKKGNYAAVTSENKINLGFPYSGSQHGTLTLRHHPRWGWDAYLDIKRGQILCDSYSNTTVLVRADGGSAKSFRCGEPADHSSTTVFIKPMAQVESMIKGAKRIYVTVNMFQEGSRTFEFKVGGYDSSKL